VSNAFADPAGAAVSLGSSQSSIPEDIPTPPSNDPVPSGPVEFNREDVDRVLSDL
jgi:hypothetical protein